MVLYGSIARALFLRGFGSYAFTVPKLLRIHNYRRCK